MVAAGGRIYASHINSLLTQVATSNIGTVAAGFTTTTARAGLALGGKLVYVRLELTCTAGITSTGGNISDTPVFTLDAPYRPSVNVNGIWSANPGTGEAQIFSNGIINLRTADVSVAPGANVRMTFNYMLD